MKHCEVTKIELYSEEVHNSKKYCFSVEYIEEDDKQIRKYRIPRIFLPISNNPTTSAKSDIDTRKLEQYIDLGFGDLRMLPDKSGNTGYMEIIKEKTLDVTMEEIERKFGQKIRIVNKK